MIVSTHPDFQLRDYQDRLIKLLEVNRVHPTPRRKFLSSRDLAARYTEGEISHATIANWMAGRVSSPLSSEKIKVIASIINRSPTEVEAYLLAGRWPSEQAIQACIEFECKINQLRKKQYNLLIA